MALMVAASVIATFTLLAVSQWFNELNCRSDAPFMKKSVSTFRPDESTRAGVLRIANGLIDAGLRHVRRPGRDAAEDVHLFRTTTKRLRALLQLIRPVISRTAFERENARLKAAAIRLAPFRDRTVAEETLKALGEPAAVLRASGLEDAPKAKSNHRRAMREAARDLEMSRSGFERLRIRGEGWAAIGPGLLRVYRQARRRMKMACADPSARAFHRWRIRVKQLYYQLEWLEPVWPKRFARLHKQLHELEDNLGMDHDLTVLRELIDANPAGFDGADAIGHLKKAAAKRSKCLRRACMPLGVKTLGKAPHRFHRACERRWSKWRKGN